MKCDAVIPDLQKIREYRERISKMELELIDTHVRLREYEAAVVQINSDKFCVIQILLSGSSSGRPIRANNFPELAKAIEVVINKHIDASLAAIEAAAANIDDF